MKKLTIDKLADDLAEKDSRYYHRASDYGKAALDLGKQKVDIISDRLDARTLTPSDTAVLEMAYLEFERRDHPLTPIYDGEYADDSEGWAAVTARSIAELVDTCELTWAKNDDGTEQSIVNHSYTDEGGESQAEHKKSPRAYSPLGVYTKQAEAQVTITRSSSGRIIYASCSTASYIEYPELDPEDLGRGYKHAPFSHFIIDTKRKKFVMDVNINNQEDIIRALAPPQTYSNPSADNWPSDPKAVHESNRPA